MSRSPLPNAIHEAPSPFPSFSRHRLLTATTLIVAFSHHRSEREPPSSTDRHLPSGEIPFPPSGTSYLLCNRSPSNPKCHDSTRLHKPLPVHLPFETSESHHPLNLIRHHRLKSRPSSIHSHRVSLFSFISNEPPSSPARTPPPFIPLPEPPITVAAIPRPLLRSTTTGLSFISGDHERHPVCHGIPSSSAIPHPCLGTVPMPETVPLPPPPHRAKHAPLEANRATVLCPCRLLSATVATQDIGSEIP